VPDLDFVAVEIAEKHVWLAWAEFPAVEHGSAGALDGAHRGVDVRGIDEAKPEVRDGA
jgi:hypothetical protein